MKMSLTGENKDLTCGNNQFKNVDGSIQYKHWIYDEFIRDADFVEGNLSLANVSLGQIFEGKFEFPQ